MIIALRRYSRFVSLCLAVVLAARTLLPYCDGQGAAAPSGLQAVCTSYGVKYLPFGGNGRDAQKHNSGHTPDQTGPCVHVFAAVCCGSEHQQSVAAEVAGSQLLATPGLGLLSFAVTDDWRVRGPPRASALS